MQRHLSLSRRNSLSSMKYEKITHASYASPVGRGRQRRPRMQRGCAQTPLYSRIVSRYSFWPLKRSARKDSIE